MIKYHRDIDPDDQRSRGSISPGSISPGSISPESIFPGSISPGSVSSGHCTGLIFSIEFGVIVTSIFKGFFQFLGEWYIPPED